MRNSCRNLNKGGSHCRTAKNRWETAAETEIKAEDIAGQQKKDEKQQQK
jgi:hypothetical protein